MRSRFFCREQALPHRSRRCGRSAATWAIALLGAFFCGAALGLTICGSCGYESDDGARFCSHCGGGLKTEVGGRKAEVGGRKTEVGGRKAEVGGRKTETGAQESDEEGAEGNALISPEAVAEDMRAARLRLKAQKAELARMFGQNAMALNLLSGKDPDGIRSKTILAFLEQCERLAGHIRTTCPVCDGSGRGMMTARSLDGRTRDMEVTGRQCDRCAGTGSLRGKGTVDERKYRRGQASEKFRAIQQSQNRVPIGNVWVPAESAEKLDVASIVMLKRAVPPVCQRCAGVGRDDCSSCRGSGRVTCRASGCERGLVERESLGGRIGGSRTASKTIHTVKCEGCGGSGLERCEKCTGAGSFICKTCNGEGFGRLCTKCNGCGLTPCRRCHGTRVYKGVPCTTCREAGSTECSSCGGTGRKR